VTGWDDRGFPTTRTVVSGWETVVKSFDNQGFLVTRSPSPAVTQAASVSTAAGGPSGTFGGGVFGANPAGKIVNTKTSKAAAARETSVPWRGATFVGLVAAAAAERLLL
jgi:hypothetical protein